VALFAGLEVLGSYLPLVPDIKDIEEYRILGIRRLGIVVREL